MQGFGGTCTTWRDRHENSESATGFGTGLAATSASATIVTVFDNLDDGPVNFDNTVIAAGATVTTDT